MSALRAGWVVLVTLWLGAASAFGENTREISPEALLAALDAGRAPLVLDVRTTEEFASGHVPGTRHVPFDEVGARLPELGAPGEVVVYCESGRRAAKAAAVLEEAGFTVRSLTGHMKAWREAERPTER